MSRNRPNLVDDPLLASAKKILSTSGPRTFEVRDWRDIMPAANAKEKSKALKDATKKAAAKGITPPKHVSGLKPGESAPGVMGQFPANPLTQGIDTAPEPCYTPGVDSPTSTFEGTTMKDAKTKVALSALAKEPAKPAATPNVADEAAAKEAATKAKAEKAATDKKAKEEAAAQRAADLKAQKEATAAKKKADLEARQKAAVEAGSKRTYFGPMMNLADKVKAGTYVKGLNGQLRSDDPVATALEACSPGNVVKLLREVLTPIWPKAAGAYKELNIGQQSMNLRNKLRGFIKNEKITIDKVKEARDAGGYADAEAQVAAKKAAAEKRAADKKAADEAKAKAKAEAASKASVAPAQTPAVQPAAATA